MNVVKNLFFSGFYAHLSLLPNKYGRKQLRFI